ncbi:MAG: hypothetical protein ONB48_13790 [candidate division KSB1 bacterium]|nr:hypothetical protein [candidate division KSB1 bacterium]MDZ7276497.1 hypothetical protein [candidate division KSB1 bacterium]MDZ7286722.1 hypothetical protein [candidate division KSB1 bacterium]MDZ7300267.1 hypothetical protein [candidate division KSB1 bacterium]MDZ7308578.1 hypothetical protein [candidate division KSB1 bacterium]
MKKALELPRGEQVPVDVDLRYWRGRLEPFQFQFMSDLYRISRITRRQVRTMADGEFRQYWVRVESLPGTFQLTEDLKTALWRLSRTLKTQSRCF